MNSLLFSALISFIIYIPTSNGGYGYGGYGGNGRDVTYGRDNEIYRQYGSGSYSSSSRSGSGNSRRSKSAPTYSYGRDNKQYGYDNDLISSLIDLNVNLYKKIKDLRKDVNEISQATPPFLGLNYAICIGEADGGEERRRMSVDYDEEPVACQPGAVIAYVGDGDDLQDSNYVLANGQPIGVGELTVLAGILSGKFDNDDHCDPCKVPDLRGRFILGVGINGINIGDIGGNPDLVEE
eukprot:CAMPEP_0201565018 /NCGR_PEP_ID=MMETSP0190_2-20130828/3841_1 /ASSEMBLY_ACC=CAM_ASM_000263 /TAXON_ID=37353 /ORGANISM="Rosalina sp." /LENGTH=236 /DNA_ID=CAMNT_0047981983 /DNA_START=99 /DNA_END=809 /DNA_ORIENTATION=-